jgi:hypothetical protein
MSSRASTDYLGQNVLKVSIDSDAGSETASTFPTSIGRSNLPSLTSGSTVVGKRLVIAIDYGTTYTGMTYFTI